MATLFGANYGTNMYKVKSSTWNNEQMLFLDKLKEDVLVPMFDYFTANPYPGVEIPAWYEEGKTQKKINLDVTRYEKNNLYSHWYMFRCIWMYS